MAASTCSGVCVESPITVACVQQRPRRPERQVLLADVEHGSPGERGDVRPVIDGPKPAVPVGRLAQDVQEFEFLGGLDALVPQLDDVHPAGKGGVDEVSKVAAVLAGIGAEVQAGGGVDVMRGHGTQPSSSKLGRYRGSPLQLSQNGAGLRGRKSRPLDLIRLVPA